MKDKKSKKEISSFVLNVVLPSFNDNKETSAKDYDENLLNEADKDDEIVDVIIDEDGSIITVDFS